MTTPYASPAASVPLSPSLEERKAEATSLPDPNRMHWYRAYVLVALVVCVVGAMILYTSVSRYLAEAKKETCGTPVCRQYAHLLSVTLNTSVDPCDNFYHYVCDGWRRRNKNSVRVEQIKQFERNVMSTALALASEAPTTGQTAIQKAAVFFKSCVAVLTVAGTGEMSSLKEDLVRAHVTWPHFAEKKYLLETIMYLNHVFELAVGLYVGVFKGAKRTTLNVAPSDRFARLYETEREIGPGNYEKYFHLFLKRFRTSGKPAITYQEQAALEETLLMPLVQAEGAAQQPKDMSVQELARHTPGFPADRWQSALQGQLEVHSDFVVRVRGLLYLKAFFNLTAHVGEETMQLFVGFAAVQTLGLLASHDIVAALHGPEESKTKYERDCSERTNAYIGKAFVVPHLDKQIRRRIRSDVSEIATTVEKTYQKIHGTILSVGLPHTLFMYVDFLRSYDLDRAFANLSDMGSDFVVNFKNAVASVRTSSAEYYSGVRMDSSDGAFYFTGEKTNDVYLLPSAIGVPMYDPDAPLAVKYAGLGAELSRAINDVSKLFAHGDNDRHNHCLEAVGNDDTGSVLLDQSLALNTAWQSFNRAGLSKPRGPGFSDQSQEELFFLFWCYNLCSSQNPERETHCNVPLQLSSDFSRVFGCRPSSPMNAKGKCY